MSRNFSFGLRGAGEAAGQEDRNGEESEAIHCLRT